MSFELARANRKKPTEAESVMWQMLRGYFCGFRFRRQHPIGNCIADFACLPKKLIIEIDGGYHFTDEQQEADEHRTDRLNQLGYTVLRITNEEVLFGTDYVLQKIKDFLSDEKR